MLIQIYTLKLLSLVYLKWIKWWKSQLFCCLITYLEYRSLKASEFYKENTIN